MSATTTLHWKAKPDDHDYGAAVEYLSLLMTPTKVAKLLKLMRKAEVTRRKAKDILRASGLEILPSSNVHVAQDIEKAISGEQLSPILLVRGQPLLIADGYHRACAAYLLSEDAEVPCQLV
ncbi:MAG: hypothetical protein JOZ39_09070 [Chloroflexi bacterium]|nr:hypothetical protein [Chloroflexota bacterium]